MAGLASLLRTLIFWLVTAAVLMMIGRYLVDLFPHSELFAGAAEWIRRATQPAISYASDMFQVRTRTGFWNPLPLGIAVAAMIAGGVLNAILEFLFVPPPRARGPEKPRDGTPSALPGAAAPGEPKSKAGAAPPPDAVGSTTFNPQGSKPAPSEGPAKRPDKIGRYEITGELGKGAMGIVYKANDPQIGRTVAIKTVLSSRAGDTAAEEFKKRFFAEARAAGRLNHPGIMKVYDLIEDAHGHPCMVLEFFEGETLDRLVQKKRPDVKEAIKIVTQSAEALAFAHEHGVVHRDMKPGNIMVSPAGHAILTDFGIAKIEDTSMTATGTILGTPAYMSPEQVQGLSVDHRTDIFSLGAVLYWLVTGERPFGGSTFTSVAYNVVHTDPRPIGQVLKPVPASLEPVVAKSLAKAPMDRYQSAREMAEALKALSL